MEALELVKQIYDRATANGKKAWMSEKQSKWMFSLLSKEGRLSDNVKNHHIAYILPDGKWVANMSLGEAIKIGEENLKTVMVHPPAFFIKRNGFNLYRIIVDQLVINTTI